MVYNNTIPEKSINPRLAVELAILHFDPDISSKDLLNLREEIILEAFKEDKSKNGMYIRDYYLYSRKCCI